MTSFTKASCRIGVLLFGMMLMAVTSHAQKPSNSDDERAFAEWRKTIRPFDPRGALCLRLQDGQLHWHKAIIKDSDIHPYVSRLMKETKLPVVALIPGPKETLGDVARVLALLSKLGADRVVFTPPLSDEAFERLVTINAN